MESKELRIGNWFQEDMTCGSYAQITAEQILDLDNDPLDDFYQPIPLTEEWLLKFGFKKDLGNDLYLESTSTSFFVWQNNRVELLDDENNICICHCQYVHQLQNLYFALTGEELTINK